MKHRTRILFMVAAAGAGVAFAQQSAKPPPLKVDKSAPMLLDEPGAGHAPLADNTACLVCHGNFAEEPFSLWHAREGTGCVDCHGPSVAHLSDEANVTPPDIMFPHDAIEPACAKCHTTHNARAADVIARWQKRCPAKTNPKEIACTDCHGNHRIAVRTVRWDRKTRELLTQDPKAPAPNAP